MDSREYRSANDFAMDVRLIFSNCYRYNPADSDVVSMARKLQDVFEVKYARMPEDSAPSPEGNDLKDDSESELSELPASESDDDDSETEREQKIKELQETVCVKLCLQPYIDRYRNDRMCV